MSRRACQHCGAGSAPNLHRELCSKCYWLLPAPTRQAYASGQITAQRVRAILAERYTSLNMLRRKKEDSRS